MKIKKMLLVAAAAMSILLTSCLSGTVTNVNYKDRAATGTPENSVVFYGFYESNVEMDWYQSDSEYAPDFQKLDAPYIVSAPVAPGSRYRLEYCYGSYRVGNTIHYWSPTYAMQENSFDIKVPEEPGIYYIGSFDGADSYRFGKNMPVTALFKAPSPERLEMDCLREAVRKYKGTAWEALFKARMEELR